MWATLLAYLIVFIGFIAFLVGALGLLMLLFEEVGESGWVSRREGDGDPR